MGFEIKERQDIINDILIDIVTNVTKINDINPGSIIRTLVEALSLQIYDQYLQLRNIYNGTRITTATEDDLDNLGDIVGLTRNQGVKAAGSVTFFREAQVVSDFTIPAGSTVGTQPGLQDVYNYVTTEEKTFYLEILNETFTFKEGVRRYKLSQRNIGAIDDLSGTKSAVPATFVENTDWRQAYSTDYIVTDVNDITVLDDCDAVTDWVETGESIAVALEATEKIEGTYSLRLGKSGTTTSYLAYSKDFALPLNIRNKVAFLNIYIVDNETLNKISRLDFRLGSDSGSPGTNVFLKRTDRTNLTTGWNTIALNYNDQTNTVPTGNPNPGHIEFILVTMNLYSASSEIGSGAILMDYIFAAPAESYTGEVIEFHIFANYPDDLTSIFFDWEPSSLDINCEAVEVGADYNVIPNSIIYKVSNIPYIFWISNYDTMSGGVDIESDDLFRTRVQNVLSNSGVATATGLENTLLEIPEITSVIVNDMPEKIILNEPQIYNDFISTYKLNNEVAFIDIPSTPTNISISDAYGGSADYTYETDYILNDNNEIEWIAGGSEPAATGDFFYVNYSVYWLGHVELLVAGPFLPIPDYVKTLIDEKIEETKPVGVSITWIEPIVVEIDVSCTVQIDLIGGYTPASVIENVNTEINNWLNGALIGEAVYLAEFYQIVMNTAGVTGVALTNWNGTVSPPFYDIGMAVNQIARPGLIVVT